jgi:hypothetical protein
MRCASRRRAVGLLGDDSDSAVSSRTVSILPLSKIESLLDDEGVAVSSLLRKIVRSPRGHLAQTDKRVRRDSMRSLRSDGSRQCHMTLLLHEPTDPHRLTVRLNTKPLRVMSRLCATSLDRKLADGCLPESHPLLAARAQVLTTRVERQKLAFQWADLVSHAQNADFRPNRVPINRNVIMANEQRIRALLDILISQTPGHIRGIAQMSDLLSDGAGPLYNHTRGEDLKDVLQQAAESLSATAL